jgi:hypothetical protein
LLTNATLTELNLKVNNIGSEGVASIVNTLKYNFKLTKITKYINRNKKIFEERRFRYTKSIFSN